LVSAGLHVQALAIKDLFHGGVQSLHIVLSITRYGLEKRGWNFFGNALIAVRQHCFLLIREKKNG